MKYKADAYVNFNASEDDEHIGLVDWIDTDDFDEATEFCETMTAKGCYCTLDGGLYHIRYYPKEDE